MTEYIVKKVDKKYNVYRIEGEHEILSKIYEFVYEVETYITLKNGIIKEFILTVKENTEVFSFCDEFDKN